MTTFVRVAEIWTPDADGHLLELGGGLYAHAPEFGAVSRAMCFGRGEGLPGQVWEEGVPIILKDLQSGSFQRAAAAQAAGLTCAVAFPVFFQQHLKAVVALFCGDVNGQSGAIEVWRNDPLVDGNMHWHDGIYGRNDPAFEAASRQTVLACGTGLVGLAWQQQASVFIDGLSESTRFVRAREAAATALTRGLAIPCPLPLHGDFVLAFLSAPSMPIATRIESWTTSDDGRSLTRAHAFTEPAGAIDGTEITVASTDVDPTIFESFATAVPKLRVGEHESLIALPIVINGQVMETVAMAF